MCAACVYALVYVRVRYARVTVRLLGNAHALKGDAGARRGRGGGGGPAAGRPGYASWCRAARSRGRHRGTPRRDGSPQPAGVVEDGTEKGGRGAVEGGGGGGGAKEYGVV